MRCLTHRNSCYGFFNEQTKARPQLRKFLIFSVLFLVVRVSAKQTSQCFEFFNANSVGINSVAAEIKFFEESLEAANTKENYLSLDQQVEIVKKHNEASTQHEKDYYRNQIIETHYYLVEGLSRKYSRGDLDLRQDLYQEGVLFMLNNFNKYATSLEEKQKQGKIAKYGTYLGKGLGAVMRKYAFLQYSALSMSNSTILLELKHLHKKGYSVSETHEHIDKHMPSINVSKGYIETFFNFLNIHFVSDSSLLSFKNGERNENYLEQGEVAEIASETANVILTGEQAMSRMSQYKAVKSITDDYLHHLKSVTDGRSTENEVKVKRAARIIELMLHSDQSIKEGVNHDKIIAEEFGITFQRVTQIRNEITKDLRDPTKRWLPLLLPHLEGYDPVKLKQILVDLELQGMFLDMENSEIKLARDKVDEFFDIYLDHLAQKFDKRGSAKKEFYLERDRAIIENLIYTEKKQKTAVVLGEELGVTEANISGAKKRLVMELSNPELQWAEPLRELLVKAGTKRAMRALKLLNLD